MNREQLEQEFNRLNISVHDFEAAHAYLEQYDPSSKLVLQEAIASAAVVAYARPFKWSNKGDAQQATAKVDIDLATIFDATQLAMHETIIRLRDQGVAHSDYDLKPTRRIRGPGSGAMSWSKMFSPLQGLDIPMFKAMAWNLNDHCVTRTIQLSRQLEELAAEGETSSGPISASERHEIVLRVGLDQFLPERK